MYRNVYFTSIFNVASFCYCLQLNNRSVVSELFDIFITFSHQASPAPILHVSMVNHCVELHTLSRCIRLIDTLDLTQYIYIESKVSIQAIYIKTCIFGTLNRFEHKYSFILLLHFFFKFWDILGTAQK